MSDSELFFVVGYLCIKTNYAYPSYIMRRLRMGYDRIWRAFRLLEQFNVIGGYAGRSPHEIKMTLEEFVKYFSINIIN